MIPRRKPFHPTGIFDCGGSGHEAIRNAGENAAATKKMVEIWEDSVRATHHFLSDAAVTL